MHLPDFLRRLRPPEVLLRLPPGIVEEHGFVLEAPVYSSPDEARLAAQERRDPLVIVDERGFGLLTEP